MFRKKNICIAISLILLIAISAFGAEEKLYGVKDIKVINGNRVTIKDNFRATEGQKGIIVIDNGPGWPKVKSLKVILNGEKVISGNEVNNQVDSFTTKVTLEKNNKIKIVAKGRPGRVKNYIEATSGGGGGGGGGGGEEDPATGLFGRVVSFGDSLLAGFIDGTLVETYQVWSLGNKI